MRAHTGGELCLMARVHPGIYSEIYFFGAGASEGRAEMRDLLGGKGANLAEMASIGLPVPPGFTITTEVCTAFYDNDRRYPDELAKQVEAALAKVEAVVGQKFGDPAN